MTVIHSVSVVLLLGFFLFIGCQSDKSKLTTIWETKTVDKSSLLKTEISSLSDDLVEKVKSDYANNPLNTDYREIELSEVFMSESDDKLFVFFNVRYVDDTQVVYEINKNGHFLSKYIYSVWSK